jgi:hypothetical protein
VLWKENVGDQYAPLSTQTLVRILVVSRNESEPSYSLEEVDLKSNPRFEALSYTWEDYSCPGNNGEHQIISIHESRVLCITANLATILHQIHRLITNRTSSARIWIDQISVNQAVLQERTQQVSLMHKIYGQAELTLL